MRAKALVLLVGFWAVFGLAFSSAPAHATDGTYWMTASGIYINAWNQGPDVDVYNGANDNDLFVAAYNPNNGYYELIYTGPGVFNSECIGDYANSQGDAKAQLNYCTGTIIPWGGNFQRIACPGGGWSFYNNHWGRYLAGSGANGSHFYLNGFQTCYFPQ